MHSLLQQIKERFPYLGDEKLAEIVALGELVSLQQDEVFVAAGSSASRVGLVVQGALRNYTLDDNGEQTTVVFATEMQVIGPYTMFLNKPATETTVAIEPSVLLVFDRDKFKALAATDLMYARVYIDVLEQQFVAAAERIEDLTRKPEQRYQQLLEKHGHFLERIPLKYLASYLGITPVSLSRIRKRISKNRN